MTFPELRCRVILALREKGRKGKREKVCVEKLLRQLGSNIQRQYVLTQEVQTPEIQPKEIPDRNPGEGRGCRPGEQKPPQDSRPQRCPEISAQLQPVISKMK